MPLLSNNTLEDFISRYQVEGPIWKADRLLSNLDNKILRNDRVHEISLMLALIPAEQVTIRNDYINEICEAHSLHRPTLMKMVAEATITQSKKEVEKKKKAPVKNKVRKLEGDPAKFPFFIELTKETKTRVTEFIGIKIDKVKFRRLLAHFGYSRYDGDNTKEDDKYNFIQLEGNIIRMVTRNRIIDHIEDFIEKQYDFTGAGYKHVDDELLINTLYDQIKTIFNKDLFARMRPEGPIVVNSDSFDTTYFYYQNGFVAVTKDGWQMNPYKDLNGSVWEKQMLQREFTYREPEIEFDQETRKIIASRPDEKGNAAGVTKAGVFADFCWHIANEDLDRFYSLCSLIGYMTHDFYEYKLRAPEFTDSSISEDSEGRTGKTLLMKMVGLVRSYCELNGKDFDAKNKNKYEDVQMGTQLIHINDVKTKGHNKFEFEDVFNDITEGLTVNAKYVTPFRIRCKIALSINKPLNIKGASQRDRIIEYELSSFFGETRSPLDYYGQWFGRDWDKEEWIRFDNFMCYCSQVFHQKGMITPGSINMGERKLVHYTSPYFIEFMEEIRHNLKTIGLPWEAGIGETYPSKDITEYAFDKRKLYDRIRDLYPDLKEKWFTMALMRKWLGMYCEVRYGISKPREWKSNGNSMIQFVNDKN